MQFLVAAWPQVKPLLDLACQRSRGRYTAEILMRHVCDPVATMNLWLALDEAGQVRAVLVTALVDYETGLREMQVTALAGRGIGMRRLRAWLPIVLQWAKSWGAHVAYFEGRPALIRSGPWTPLAVSAEIRL